VLDAAQHLGRPGRVVGPEHGVVGLVEVAGGQLAVEILDRAQQEAPLLVEIGEITAGGSVTSGDPAAVRRSSRATRARSASVAVRREGRQRRKASARSAPAVTATTTGSTHTSAPAPVAGGTSSSSSP
jgi:hypothetical protein